MTDMDSDDDPIDLSELALDEPVPYVPAPEPGRVDSTSVFGGIPVRVATAGETIRLTIAGVDGMATVLLDDNDAELLNDMLTAGQRDVRRRRSGR